MLYVIVGLTVFCLPLLYVLGRIDEKKVRRDWERLLKESKPHKDPPSQERVD